MGDFWAITESQGLKIQVFFISQNISKFPLDNNLLCLKLYYQELEYNFLNLAYKNYIKTCL